ANVSESDEPGPCQPPDALRPLRMGLDPFLVRATARSAAALCRRVVPGAAASHVREALLCRQQDRLERQLVDGEGSVGVLLVVIEAPLGDVAVHVVQAPWVGLLLADLVRQVVGVPGEPRVVAEFARVVAEAVGSGGAGAAGPLPLRLRRQAVGLAGLLR